MGVCFLRSSAPMSSAFGSEMEIIKMIFGNETIFEGLVDCE